MQKHYCEGPRLGGTAYVQCSECRALVCRPNGLQSSVLRPRPMSRKDYIEGTKAEDFDRWRSLMASNGTKSEAVGLSAGPDVLLGRLTDAERAPRRAKGLVLLSRVYANRPKPMDVGLWPATRAYAEGWQRYYARWEYVTAERRLRKPEDLVSKNYLGPDGRLRPFVSASVVEAKRTRPKAEPARSDAAKKRERLRAEVGELRKAIDVPRSDGVVRVDGDLARRLGLVVKMSDF